MLTFPILILISSVSLPRCKNLQTYSVEVYWAFLHFALSFNWSQSKCLAYLHWRLCWFIHPLKAVFNQLSMAFWQLIRFTNIFCKKQDILWNSNFFTSSGLKLSKFFLDLALFTSCPISVRYDFSTGFLKVVPLGCDDLFIPRHFQRLVTVKQ